MALSSAGDRCPRDKGVAGERVLEGELLEPAEPSCIGPIRGETGTDTGIACGTLLASREVGVTGEGVALGSAWWELGC